MSKRFTIDNQDFNKWAKNTLVFFAPALLVFLLQLQAGKSVEESLSSIYLWALNTSIDLTKKFIAEN